MAELGLQKIVSVMGTNASGKSDLALYLAQEFCGEVVSADSRQVFRGLDIGAGKVSLQERQLVRHHLIDVAGLNEDFSLAQFQSLAFRSIDEILRRRRLPILVGGTGLYLMAVLEGYVLPPVAPNQRLRTQLEQLETELLVKRLSQLDGAALASIDVRNRRRLVRAIEILESGSSLERVALKRYLPLKLGLTWPKEVLRERIRLRLERRMNEGMVEEVRDLLASGARREWLDALGLEYRHILWFLQGRYKSLEELRLGLESAIWRFAQRQMTWFKRDRDIVWLDSTADYFREATVLVGRFCSVDGTNEYYLPQ